MSQCTNVAWTVIGLKLSPTSPEELSDHGYLSTVLIVQNVPCGQLNLLARIGIGGFIQSSALVIEKSNKIEAITSNYLSKQ